jgi:uncharacterized protein (DUF433 family)
MVDSDIIVFSEKVPRLRNRRVTIFDVMLTLDISDEPAEAMSEMWDLSQKEINEIIDYIESNRDELERLEEECVNQLE